MTDVLVPVPKLETGVAGLDQLTLGGLPMGRTTLVAGTTGTGKTLLAQEFLVRGVEQFDDPAVFVTFEERPEDIRRNAASLGLDIAAWEAKGKWAFVDASMEGPEGEEVVGGYDFGGLVARIRHAVKKVGAKRVAFDSLGAVFSRYADRAIVRFELQQMANALREMEVTSLLTAERSDEYGLVTRFNVEEFVADNVLVLRNALDSEKRRRTLEVLKLRGAPHRTGEWLFTIDPRQGLVVLPLSVIGNREQASTDRVTTGVAELDRMCGGGLFRNALTFVSGPTGIGKTLLACHFVKAGLDAGERCVLFSFEESRDQLARNITSWGSDLDAMEATGRLLVVCDYPELASLEDHFLAVKQAVDDFRPHRLAVDNLSALERVASVRGTRDVLIGLGSFVKQHQVTSLFTATSSLVGGGSVTEAHMSALTDTIVLLRYVEVASEVHRSIVVLKMRGSAHDPAIREFTIGGRGLRIGEPVPVDIMAGSVVFAPAGASSPIDLATAGRESAF